MNLKSTLRKSKLMAIGISGSLLAASPAMAAVKPVRINFLSVLNGEEKPAKKTKAKTKAFATLNNSAVKIYPDALKREMHVIAKDNEGKAIDFFIFDLEGTLLHNYKMESKEHKKISGLARGTYVYRVFTGDEETAAGKFEIR